MTNVIVVTSINTGRSIINCVPTRACCQFPFSNSPVSCRFPSVCSLYASSLQQQHRECSNNFLAPHWRTTTTLAGECDIKTMSLCVCFYSLARSGRTIYFHNSSANGASIIYGWWLMVKDDGIKSDWFESWFFRRTKIWLKPTRRWHCRRSIFFKFFMRALGIIIIVELPYLSWFKMQFKDWRMRGETRTTTRYIIHLSKVQFGAF